METICHDKKQHHKTYLSDDAKRALALGLFALAGLAIFNVLVAVSSQF